LKKQSQFVAGHIGVNPYMKGDYGNNPVGMAQKNKANQACPESVGWSQFVRSEFSVLRAAYCENRKGEIEIFNLERHSEWTQG